MSTRGRLTYGGYNPEYQTDPADRVPMNVASERMSTRSKLPFYTSKFVRYKNGRGVVA